MGANKILKFSQVDLTCLDKLFNRFFVFFIDTKIYEFELLIFLELSFFCNIKLPTM